MVAGYEAHEAWSREELARQKKDLQNAERMALDVETVKRLYPVLREKLEKATEQDRRFVLERLAARVVVAAEGLTLDLSVPHAPAIAVGTSPRPAPTVSHRSLA